MYGRQKRRANKKWRISVARAFSLCFFIFGQIVFSVFSVRFQSTISQSERFFRYVYLYIYTGLHALWQDSHSSQIKRKVRIKTSNRARNNGLNAQHTRLMNYNKQSRVSFIADHFNILRVREKKNAMENSQDDFFLFRNFSSDLIGRCISHTILYSDHIILCRKTVYQRIR